MSRKYKKPALKLIFIFLLAFLAFGFYLVFKSGPFRVEEIIVNTDYNLKDKSAILSLLEKTRGKNIFFLDSETLRKEILSDDIEIAEAEIKKEFFGKLLITLRKRIPVAVIPLSDNFFLVDKDGLIFKQQKESVNIPELYFNLQNLPVGSTIDKREQNVILIINALKGQADIQSISVKGEEIEVRLTDYGLALLPLNDEVKTKIHALQTIINRFRIEGTRPIKIDLRFEKPVVTL